MVKIFLQYNFYRYVVWGLLSIMPLASLGLPHQSMATDTPKSPMWVIDGCALQDSVFQYSLAEMQSDSAAMLVERSLSHISASDIKLIKCIRDSVQTVHITTDKNIPILIILNGEEYKNEVTVSVGKVLAGNSWIQEIIRGEIPYLDEYGIEKTIVLHEDNKQLLFEYPPNGAVLIITTQKPYNRVVAVLEHAMSSLKIKPHKNLKIKPHKKKGGKR